MGRVGTGVEGWPAEQPVLNAADLSLRPWRRDDAPAVFAHCQDPEIQRWTTVPTPYLREHAQGFVTELASAAWSNRAGAAFCVTDAGETVLGSCSLVSVDQPGRVAEVGYWVAPDARGRGIAERAVRLLASWAFGTGGLHRLELLIAPDNQGSIKVAERVGAEREGLMRSKALINGERCDMALFALVREP